MKRNVLRLINKILYKFNAKVVSNNLGNEKIFIETRYSNSNIFDLIKYKTNSNQRISLLTKIPILNLGYQPFLKAWVETLKHYEEEDLNQAIEDRESFKYLKGFYEKYKPKNIAKYVGLGILDFGNEYFNLNPIYTVMPWQEESYKDFAVFTQEMMKAEFEEFSNEKYKIEYGQKRYGPISEKLLYVEYERLIKVYDSIKNSGLDNDFTTRGYILISKNKYKYIVYGALHRTAALIALCNEELPIEISLVKNVVINRDEFKNWHHVKSGLYTEEQALQVFDNFFKPLIPL